MSESQPSYTWHSARFDAAHCATCAREVVLYHDLRDGEMVLACIHCAARIDPADTASKHRAVDDMAVRKLGVAFAGDEDVPEFEGCGKPNCNKGQCKSTAARHPFKDDAPVGDDAPGDAS